MHDTTGAGGHLDAVLDRLLAVSAAVSVAVPAPLPAPAPVPAPLPAPALAPASHAAVRDIAYATIRCLGRVRMLAGRLNARPPAPLLGALQAVALAQLLDGRRPAAIVIDQAVAAAAALPDSLGNRFSAGFLNATLRRFVRERDALLAEAEGDPVARHNHPAWWLERLRAAHPQRWQDIVAESLVHAPMTLRVNRRRLGVAAASARLALVGIAHRRTGPEALTLAAPRPVGAIPGFAEGDFAVQDAGAQLAAPLLAPAAGDRVLDACAAPGGKTTHLLELADCAVLALDIDAARLARVSENLHRERLPVHADWPPPGWGATLRTSDAGRPADWWDGRPFDRILVDAPCTASGIVRRHPDILWHRARRDIATFAGQQQRLLEALWPLLKPGGTLLYVTCSIFPEEGEGVIATFCARHADCGRMPVETPWAKGPRRLVQLLPTRSPDRDHDGFTYALLSKRP